MAADLADTIAATATPWGQSAVAVVRLSGPDAREIAARLCPGGPPWHPRRASLRQVVDAEGAPLDDALVTWMPGPRSATGEDVVELSCHGNPVIVAALLEASVAAGARPAGPGEFTRRAVVNGRMDLLQAEAIDAVVRSATVEGVRLARGAGALGEALAGWRGILLDRAAELEASLDHPGEGEEEEAAWLASLDAVHGELSSVAETWGPTRVRVDGARVALVGAVNAGKSSLLNALVEDHRALVSDRPGTTRDVVEARIVVDGLALTLLDTAGARPDAGPLEQAGLALARRRAADVDRVLLVTRLDRPAAPEAAALRAELPDLPCWTVGTHLDRVTGTARPVDHAVACPPDGPVRGVGALRAALRADLSTLPSGAAATLVSERQHALVRALATHVAAAAAALRGRAGPAVAAEELTLALERLDRLSGADTREEVLDRLFARFCIGK